MADRNLLSARHRTFAEELQSRFHGFEPAPVEVGPEIEDDSGRVVAEVPPAFLAEARQLVEVWPTAARRLDRDRTTLREEKPPCPVCGLSIALWGEPEIELSVTRRGRRGLTVLELDGAQIFQLEGEGKFVLCTDEVKDYVEDRGLSNVAFWEAGEVI